MITTPTFRQIRFSLAINANSVYPDWLADVQNLAGSLGQGLRPSGLFDLVATPAEWDRQYPPAPDAAGDLVPVPFPVAPVLPADLQVGAAAAAIAVHERLVKQVVQYRELCEVLKAAILDSIGQDNVRAVSDAISGTRLLQPMAIMDAMRALHGTANVATLNGWKAELQKPHDPAYDFNHLATSHRFLNARLEVNGQGESELTKCTNIEHAVSTFPGYRRAIAEYYTATPIVAQRTIAGLTAYVMLHQPNITVGAAHYGNAAMPPALAHMFQAYLDQHYPVAGPGVGAGPGRGRGADNRAPNGRGGRGQGGRGRGAAPGNRNYCFKHGYDGHRGPACNFMWSANQTALGAYTAAQIAAPDHTTGGSVYNL